MQLSFHIIINVSKKHWFRIRRNNHFLECVSVDLKFVLEVVGVLDVDDAVPFAVLALRAGRTALAVQHPIGGTYGDSKLHILNNLIIKLLNKLLF